MRRKVVSLIARRPNISAESEQHKTLINLQYAFEEPLGERCAGQVRADLAR